jgi:ubiquinone/menaquinone biosynthesis C-methylase UbiE
MKPEINWHTRFVQQSRWTHDLRQYLFEKCRLIEADAILEVGCGTGAILTEIHHSNETHLFGLDINREMIFQARENARAAKLTIADAHQLPIPTDRIDITFCHFLLLWVKSPLHVLQEMKRVTRPGGAILVMAEPNYSERLDEPETLRTIGQLQTESLRAQGADVDMGSKLNDLFKQAGIEIVESGKLEQLVENKPSSREDNLEWSVMEEDLKKYLSQDKLDAFRKMDAEARHIGTRVIHVPTSFAWGLV